ncbi:MAG: peptidoglycan-binding domain-containing protein [Desulfobacteria bacterium]
MAATEILVQVVTVDVLDKTNFSEWSFKANVRRLPSGTTKAFGTPGDVWEANEGDTLDLSGWDATVAIKPKDKKIEVSLKGSEKKGLFGKDLGSVKVTLNTPIYHGYDLTLVSSKKLFAARIKVTITAEDTATPPGNISTVTSAPGSSSYSTIHDGVLEKKMVHICPVIPVPWATGIPPIAKGVESLPASDQENLAIAAGTTKPNALVNPSLIPAIDPGDPEFDNLCARIYITQYRPKTLDLKKLVWVAKTDNIRFFDGGRNKKEVHGGREVKTYGVPKGNADEEGVIEVRWDGEGRPLLAVYRAWVGKPKYVWTRANIVKCSTSPIGGVAITNPTTTAAQIKAQIAYNNVMFWQAGLKMVPDPDTTTYNGAVKKDDGIFEITASQNYTFNVPDAPDIVAPLLNQRGGVFNVAYIHTVAGYPTLNGEATDRRLSAAEGTETLGGSPSTSWVQPTGVYPDADGVDITMKTFGPSDPRDAAQKDLAGDKQIDKICGCIMTQQGATLPGSITLVHELGHVLCLHHRGCGGNEVTHSYDGVDHLAGPLKDHGHPWVENVMTYGPNTSRQDFDLVQTRVLRRHALVRDSATEPPGVPPVVPPKVQQPVPAAWLPTKADRILVQEYLIWKKKGLKCGPYDLGDYGPDGDGVDGIVGPVTRGAIKEFQRDHGGLKTDGSYGPKTAEAFDQEING